MLRKGFKDDESEKKNEVFENLIKIEFIPDNWKEHKITIDKTLQELTAMSLNDQFEGSTDIVIEKLQASQFSFDNYEKLGDLLLKILALETKDRQTVIAEKAVAIYEFAQQNDKTFSFGLIQKIMNARQFLAE